MDKIILIKKTLLLFLFIKIFFIILTTKIYFLQIKNFKKYLTKSKNNFIKKIIVNSNRGLIFDRNGEILVKNKNIHNIKLLPKKINNINFTIKKIKKIIKIKKINLNKYLKTIKHKKNIPITIKYNINKNTFLKISKNKKLIPEIQIKKYKIRYYLYGKILSHITGYTSKINKKDINEIYKNNNFSIKSRTGKLGIEKYYEKILNGKNGYKILTINNKGKTKNKKTIKAKNGKNIYLTIDIKIQKFIEKTIKKNNKKLAILIANSNNSEILSMISHPKYNSNTFSKKISKNKYIKLIKNKNFSMINRTIQGIYPPASTIKPYISILALKEKTIKKNDIMFDPGWWKIPKTNIKYKDWKKNGHGNINIIKAIEESSDTFFYKLSYILGINKIKKWIKKFGYGKLSGIDLYKENNTTTPSRKWKIKKFKKKWYKGDTISIGIGQGYLTATPIQILKSLITLINNGKIKIPHLLHAIKHKKKFFLYKNKKNKKKIKNTNIIFWNIIKFGMYKTANNINGTTYKKLNKTLYKIAAKSGTAQIFSIKLNKPYNEKKIPEFLYDHKLITAYAPYKKPKIAITIIIENSGSTNNIINSLTKKIFDFINKKKTKC